MDGTLADVSSIRHHVQGASRDFDAFHAASVDVPPNEQAVRIARESRERGLAVLIVTARRSRWRHHTAWFLAMHGIPSDALVMRGDRDDRSDVEVKRDMLDTIIRKAWTPVLAVDDRPEIIAMWESEGIPTVTIPGWED